MFGPENVQLLHVFAWGTMTSVMYFPVLLLVLLAGGLDPRLLSAPYLPPHRHARLRRVPGAHPHHHTSLVPVAQRAPGAARLDAARLAGVARRGDGVSFAVAYVMHVLIEKPSLWIRATGSPLEPRGAGSLGVEGGRRRPAHACAGAAGSLRRGGAQGSSPAAAAAPSAAPSAEAAAAAEAAPSAAPAAEAAAAAPTAAPSTAAAAAPTRRPTRRPIRRGPTRRPIRTPAWRARPARPQPRRSARPWSARRRDFVSLRHAAETREAEGEGEDHRRREFPESAHDSALLVATRSCVSARSASAPARRPDRPLTRYDVGPGWLASLHLGAPPRQ